MTKIDIDLLTYPPAYTTPEKDEYYRNLTTEEILENNRQAIAMAANAPDDKTLKEYYSSYTPPWKK